jgi:predicted TIM-barrel fold metal-dependent hydrolase
MWVRQSALDADSDLPSPIPTRIASNEEFIPPVQTPQQKEFAARLATISDEAAQGQGLSRRDFLRTGSGMAAALLAMNQTFGPYYDVDAAEVRDQQAFAEKWPKNQFIFDVQTHHIDMGNKWHETKEGKGSLSFFMMLRPQAKEKKAPERLELLNRVHYVKEIFGDSDTVMAIISGVPSRTWNINPLPPDQMAGTRDYINQLAGSQRVLSHGLLRPNLGKGELDEMERQVKKLNVCGWKMYTGAELGEKPWFMNDEKVAYPFWERTRKLKVRNLCVHKGLPLGAFNTKACMPDDLERAALDFPDLNFIVYHSGYRGTGFLALGRGEAVKDPPMKGQEIPWISNIFRILRKNPKIRNIYFELGSTFQQLSMSNPETCLHMLGQMIQTAGADHIVWGTDCIWGGSPQSQIDRLRRLKMTDELMEKFKYPQLTDAIKNQILGLNAARLFDVDVKAKRQAIKTDKLTRLREEYRRNPTPSNTQYGWVWVDDQQEPTVPVGE